MGKEYILIFCHDKYNRKLKCHQCRLFKVKMVDYEIGENVNYFSFKIIDRITPNGYIYRS